MDTVLIVLLTFFSALIAGLSFILMDGITSREKSLYSILAVLIIIVTSTITWQIRTNVEYKHIYKNINIHDTTGYKLWRLKEIKDTND